MAKTIRVRHTIVTVLQTHDFNLKRWAFKDSAKEKKVFCCFNKMTRDILGQSINVKEISNNSAFHGLY